MIKNPIKRSQGFEKKLLSEYKLDVMGLCGFGCKYCSSNSGNYLRINRKRFADLTEQQLRERVFPADDPSLTFRWLNIAEKLELQLAKKCPGWGKGKTLVFSMLTDGFSPLQLQDGTTERALRLVLDKTSFRVRVLTKNAAVGSPKWIKFFRQHPGRFVVGLSVGTSDNQWAQRVEIGTSIPSARLKALRNLQDAGIPTYGMMCPVFPDVLAGDALEGLVEEIRPELGEHVWAEPYNDRQNWSKILDGYPIGSPGYSWLTAVYAEGRKELWSAYAAELYQRLRRIAKHGRWLHKLR